MKSYKQPERNFGLFVFNTITVKDSLFISSFVAIIKDKLKRWTTLIKR